MTDTMAAMGHASAQLTLTVYAQAMRLGEAERAALRALIDGAQWDRMGRVAVQPDDPPGLPKAA